MCFKVYCYLIKITKNKSFAKWASCNNGTWGNLGCLLNALCVYLYLSISFFQETVPIQWVELSERETRMFTLTILFLKYFWQLKISFLYAYVLHFSFFCVLVNISGILLFYIIIINSKEKSHLLRWVVFYWTEFACASFVNKGM